MFFCTAKWISYVYIHTPSVLNFLSIWVTAEHWVVSWAMQHVFSLVISVFIHNINSVCVSTPVSQFLPPLPSSPLVSVYSLCFYFYFANKIIYTIFLDSTYIMLIYGIYFSDWLHFYDTISVHPRLYKWPDFVPFSGWVIFHGMKASWSFPRWTSSQGLLTLEGVIRFPCQLSLFEKTSNYS